jgi:pSer/pThr/pTyr-binding forkhead associated (FHA) protein
MTIPGTVFETEEDVARAMAALRRGGAAGNGPLRGGAAAGAGPAPTNDAAPFFRPSARPATPILTIYDDGAETGETIRIRKDEFVIGRMEGDLTIPNDSQMSSRHAMLQRTIASDGVHWTLVDLKSTNGTYVRVMHAILEHNSEFLVGRTRLRFEKTPRSPGAQPRPISTVQQGTRHWQPAGADDESPAVIELRSEKASRRVPLSGGELWIGSDAAQCQMALPADPFVNSRHARVRRHESGQWIVENNHSVNGVWFRVEQVEFNTSCRFMLGEQLFLVQVP